MNKLFAIILSLCLSSSMVRAAEDISDSFKLGIQAFRSGDYKTALEHFVRARQGGLSRPALDYNLGVSYYKMKDYNNSRSAFLRATEDASTAPLAFYNLGLVDLRLGNKQSASNWFREARNGAQEIRLQRLADRMLSKLENRTVREATDDGTAWWLTSASLNAGYDDNLIDPSDQSGSEEGDTFYEFFALASGPLAGSYYDGIHLDLSLFANRHKEIDAYDMDVLRGGLSSVKPLGSWQSRVGIEFERSTLGGEDYLGGTHLLLTAQRRFDDKRLRLRYRASHINALNRDYEQLEGQRHQLDAEIRRRISHQRHWRIAYQLELNDRKDLAASTTFTSYSPTRHSLRLEGGYPLASALTLDSGLRFRISRYNDDNRFSDGVTDRREDRQFQASIKLRYDMPGNWEMQFEYNYTDNDSSVDDYDYDRNLYLFGLSVLF